MASPASSQIQESEFISFNLESGSQMRDAEFARACGRWTKLAGERGRRLDRDALLRKTFAQIDVDDSGSICESEYMTLAANNDKMSLDIQKIVFAMADTSGDGVAPPLASRAPLQAFPRDLVRLRHTCPRQVSWRRRSSCASISRLARPSTIWTFLSSAESGPSSPGEGSEVFKHCC